MSAIIVPGFNSTDVIVKSLSGFSITTAKRSCTMQ